MTANASGTSSSVPDGEGGQRHAWLLAALREQLGITGLRQVGEGLDAKVYRADSPELGAVAIKVPHARWVSTANEPRLDTRTLLRQEFLLSEHLRAHDLPTPEVFLLHTEDAGVDFIVSRFVESDGTQLPDTEFGRLIRAIHDVPLPGFDLVAAEPSADADKVLAERITQRLTALAAITSPPAITSLPAITRLPAITSLLADPPDIGAALSADPMEGGPTSLLHMDLRPANILARSGRLVAILDWSNALTGDAALDLARTAEYGHLTDGTLAAYGNDTAFSMTPRTPRQIIYRLDTAVMLSHVFLNDAPDAAQARHYIQRTVDLCQALGTGS